jgi:hypothetical protein
MADIQKINNAAVYKNGTVIINVQGPGAYLTLDTRDVNPTSPSGEYNLDIRLDDPTYYG